MFWELLAHEGPEVKYGNLSKTLNSTKKCFSCCPKFLEIRIWKKIIVCSFRISLKSVILTAKYVQLRAHGHRSRKPYIMGGHERLISMLIWSAYMILKSILLVSTRETGISEHQPIDFESRSHMFKDDIRFLYLTMWQSNRKKDDFEGRAWFFSICLVVVY